MKRIIIDQTLCDGCGECVKQCEQEKGQSCCYLEKTADGSYTVFFCRGCDQPACLDTCMSGAVFWNEDTGGVCYDREKCASCYMCVMVCPYGIPAPRQDGGVARCDHCHGRNGGLACVSACTRSALSVEDVSDE